MTRNPAAEREILVNVTPREQRAALLENGSVQELYVERASRRGLVGNLYRGRVSRVLPGMQAAFVDVGLARTAFLHAGDIARTPPPDGEPADTVVEDINRLVSPGQDLLVQVLKDPLGTKGARLTTEVALPSRFLVYLPFGRGVGVSVRIEDAELRERLRTSVLELAGNAPAAAGGGYIVRTAAERATPEALRADMLFLARLWEHLRQQQLRVPPASLVHAELPLPARVLRDEYGADVRRVLVDDAAECAALRAFAGTFMPEAVERIEHYAGARPLFELHGIEAEIARALDRQVPLQSGGTIVIDQTESMTTIDVNTGGFVGHRDPEETVFRTNLEAAAVIARQLRLRNLGGIVVIDFIDMQDPGHHAQLRTAFQAALAGDRAQTQLAEGAPLGLVAMTRKRTRESLEHLLCEPCPACEGRGFVRSVETVCHDIYREALRQGGTAPGRELVVLAHPEVIERLLDEEAAVLAELERRLGGRVRLQAEARHGVEQYDIVLA